MRPTLAYTSARILLLVVVLGVLYLIGARSWLLIALGLVVSGVVSLVLLSRQRDAMSGAITSRLSTFRRRLDEGASREDNDS
jgi:cell division protein FtsW (lipid II flippase)